MASMTKILSFGPGPRSKGHPDADFRDHTALVVDYGKSIVTCLQLYGGEVFGMAVYVGKPQRTEFDAWYKADPKTPPERLAEIYKQHARRFGATDEAIEVLRQLVPISQQECNEMTAQVQSVRPTFGAPVNKAPKGDVETKEAKPAATPKAAAKAAKAAATPKADAKAVKAAAAPKVYPDAFSLPHKRSQEPKQAGRVTTATRALQAASGPKKPGSGPESVNLSFMVLIPTPS